MVNIFTQLNDNHRENIEYVIILKRRAFRYSVCGAVGTQWLEVRNAPTECATRPRLRKLSNKHYEDFACTWREVGVTDGASHGSVIVP